MSECSVKQMLKGVLYFIVRGNAHTLEMSKMDFPAEFIVVAVPYLVKCGSHRNVLSLQNHIT